MFGEYVVTIPIATPTQSQREATANEIQQVSRLTHQSQLSRAGILDVLRMEYEVEKPGQALAEFELLDGDTFVREVKKRRGQKSKPLSPSSLKALRELYDSEVPALLQKRAQILLHERKIAAVVHAVYKLAEEDLRVLRDTQPPRMPPGW
jgi:hypothetical protein